MDNATLIGLGLVSWAAISMGTAYALVQAAEGHLKRARKALLTAHDEPFEQPSTLPPSEWRDLGAIEETEAERLASIAVTKRDEAGLPDFNAEWRAYILRARSGN